MKFLFLTEEKEFSYDSNKSLEEIEQDFLEAYEEYFKLEVDCFNEEFKLYLENMEIYNEANNPKPKPNNLNTAKNAMESFEKGEEVTIGSQQQQQQDGNSNNNNNQNNDSIIKKIVDLIVKIISGLWTFIKKILTAIGNFVITVLTRLKNFVDKLNKQANQQQANQQQANQQQNNTTVNPSIQEDFSENFDFDIFNEFSGVGTPNMASEMSVTQNYAAYNPVGNASPTINSQPSYTPQPKEYNNPGGSAPKMETLQELDQTAKYIEDPSDYNDFDNIITTVRNILIKPQQDDNQIININNKLKEIYNKMLQQVNLNNSRAYQTFDKMSSRDDEIVNYNEYIKRATYYTNIYYRFNQNYPKVKAISDNIIKKISTFENDNVILGKSLLQRCRYKANKNQFKKSISEFCSLMKKIFALQQKVINKFIEILNRASHSFNTSDANGNFASKKISKYNHNTR